MTGDMRAQILGAVRTVRIKLGPNALEIAQRGGTIHLTPEEAGDLTDAVMVVVQSEIDERAFQARHYTSGRCRHCGGRPAACAGQQGRPHRMYCELYVGPLEHRSVGGGFGTFGWVSQCSCGGSYGQGEQCPNAALDWRGPRGDCEHCSIRERDYEPGVYARLVAETQFGHDVIAHRLYKGLLLMGVTTTEQVAAMTDDDVYDLRNAGRQSLERVRSRFPGPGAADGGEGA